MTNIVVMGMGEPMHNYEHVWRALRTHYRPGRALAWARVITLWQCRSRPVIERMAEEGLQIDLAVSLHAPNDDLRYPIGAHRHAGILGELVAAVRRYVAQTDRRVTF